MLVIALLCLLGSVSGFEDKTITQYLTDNGDQYSTLLNLLTSAGLESELSQLGPFTLFAPTNAAFSTLPNDRLQELGTDAKKLASVLKYHVVHEFVLVPMIVQPTDKPTLEGQILHITSNDSSLVLNGVAQVGVANNDIVVNNGVIQPINTVLFPPSFDADNIAQTLLRDDAMFQDMFLALYLADLVTLLENGDYTVFAPVNHAFEAYRTNLLDPSAPNAQAIYQEVLKYHIVPGGRLASQFSNDQFFTLHGTTLNITIASGVQANGANVIAADIIASNGVIHAIDKVLIPQDINQIVQG